MFAKFGDDELEVCIAHEDFPPDLLRTEHGVSNLPARPGRWAEYPPLVFGTLSNGKGSADCGVAGRVGVGVIGGRFVPRDVPCASAVCVEEAGRLFDLRGVLESDGVVVVDVTAAAAIAAAAMACGLTWAYGEAYGKAAAAATCMA